MGLLHRTAQIAEEYLALLPDRRVGASLGFEDVLASLDTPLPEEGEDAEDVLDALAALEPGMNATAGPRYFGFVTGGALPVTVAADWLVATWDGPHFGRVASPAGAAVEDVAARWLLEALELPRDARVGFVTGATMANLVGLAAARHRVLAGAGWDVEEQGLGGAPPVRVLVGDEVHVSLLKALRLLGFGSGGVERIPADANGAMLPGPLAAALREGAAPAIVCAQAGNVNTGACDPFLPIVAAAREAGAWVHVDGAFGLWAAVSPKLSALVAGADGADSWALDAHKWLNVPYDCGVVIVADGEAHAAAMSATADYLLASDDGLTKTPEMSRRGRQIPVYAALRHLGRRGIAELVERNCAQASRLAAAMARVEGVAVLNDVVLNQVLLRFDDDDERTARVIEQLESGETGMLPEDSIEPVEEVTDFEDLPEEDGPLDRAVVLKLNGGLGTSMGVTQAKSLIEAKDGLTFLDVVARQVEALRERAGAAVPLVLMNSFHTREDSLAKLAEHPELESPVPADFVQHKEPKLLVEDLTPVRWPDDPSQEWCPPGHGDLYTALLTSGMLDALLDAGYRWAFISNSDNLAAVLEPH